METRIGVLALQGCVTPHRPHLESLGATHVEVRSRKDLEQVDGLILPGGESTTLLKLIDTFGLEDSLRTTFARVPVWGICAGAILLAREVRSPVQRSFGVLPIGVDRNAYGRQLDSFNCVIAGYPVSFIRAPRIFSIEKGVTVLARHGNDPVWLQAGTAMATTFHPELTEEFPSPMHRQFLDLVRKNAG